MKRILVTRLLCLQIAPFLAAALFVRFYPLYLPHALLVAGLIYVVAVALSICDGALIVKGGAVCERSKDGFSFWLWITLQLSLVVFVIAFASQALFA